jgi:hypothetical protein
MKPSLSVLLGAGSTMMLCPEEPTIGMPSTADLSKRIANMKYPMAVYRGTPIIFGAGHDEPYVHNRPVPVLPLINHALSNEFGEVDFELILHAIEQLQPLVAAGEHRKDRYRPVLAAFTEVARRSNILNYLSVLSIARHEVILEIHQAIRSRILPSRPLPLHDLVQALEEEFRLAVFTLNYDDVIDRACQTWFDGFTDACGEASSFDARAFDCWRDAEQPVLVHLHGSVRFGHKRDGIGLAKYSDAESAFNTIKWTRTSEDYSHGQIVSAGPIISSLNKVAKLSHNPEPFGYYYRAFIDAMLGSERLLVIGYGGGAMTMSTRGSISLRRSIVMRAEWRG